MIGELTPNQIEYLLREQIIGRLGCGNGEELYIVPVTYVYDRNYIYGFTHEGLKVEMMRKNPNVCFQVDSIVNFANWKSAIAWGKYEELQGNDAIEAMLLIGNRLKPFMVSESAGSHEGISDIHKERNPTQKSVAYRIKVERKTGRFEKR